VYALVEAIINLLRLRKAYEFYKTDFADFGWRLTLIALGIIYVVVAVLVVILILLL